MLPHTDLCRLCLVPSHDLRRLYHENDQANELYEITTNYFHPMILNMSVAKHLKGICLECWRHIWDFHSFQKSVVEAQSKLEVSEQHDQVMTELFRQEDFEPLNLEDTAAIKREEEAEFICLKGPVTIQSNNDNHLDNMSNVVVVKNETLTDSLTVLEETVDVLSDCSDADADDEILSENLAKNQTQHLIKFAPTEEDMCKLDQYPCSKCERVFNTYMGLKIHSKVHRPPQKCIVCGHIFKRLNKFRTHIQKNHSKKLIDAAMVALNGTVASVSKDT